MKGQGPISKARQSTKLHPALGGEGRWAGKRKPLTPVHSHQLTALPKKSFTPNLGTLKKKKIPILLYPKYLNYFKST